MHKLISVFVFSLVVVHLAHADPLPSWNDTSARQQIIAFVDSVTDPASDHYVIPSDRIAVFDNDGTLWAEQPMYFQLLYAIDRLREMAKADPSVASTDVLRAAVNGDMGAVGAAGKQGLVEIVMVSHAGMSVEEFQADVRKWVANSRHPEAGRPYGTMLYQPMLELLRYLRDEGFATYIVSGGGLHFMRAFAEEAYGIPPQQVVGSAGNASYTIVDGVPTIMKDPGIAFIDDGAGKPVGIDSKIGKRPIFVAGNSDGDFEMLEWATSGDGPRFGLIVHHTDSKREWAYDRDSHIGRLDRGLDVAESRGWLLVDMAEDWAAIFPRSSD
jgi:phosphoglycolate phosphatase-like HAD superfamily hydrolase